MDKKDRTLLSCLDENSRETLTNLAKKLKTSKEVVHYRINKLEKEGIITQYYTIIDLSKLGYVAYKIYFQFQNLTKEKEKGIIDFLLLKERIFWIATSSGSWDMMIGCWAKNVIDFNDTFLEEMLNRFSRYILRKEITITKYNLQWSRKWFTEQDIKKTTKGSKVGGEPKAIRLDEKDISILKILAKNARLPLIEIAKKAKISPKVAQYRIQQLKEKEVIQSFRITPNLTKFNYGFFKAFLYLQNITSEKQEKLTQFCKQQKNILNIVTCVGPWDFEIEFEVEDFQKFNDLIREIKESFPELIKNYESVLITSEPKVDFMPGCLKRIERKN